MTGACNGVQELKAQWPELRQIARVLLETVLQSAPHSAAAVVKFSHADLVRTALPNSPVSNQVAAALI